MHSAIDLSNAIEVLFSHFYSIVRPFEDHFLIFIAPLFPTSLINILARLCYFAISNFRATTYQIIEYVYHHLQFDFDSCFLWIRYQLHTNSP
ncbi:hypothetical protein CY34DRAFT_500933 [Suillus luteus UH-Slu-Lm8-n1]|uniref:Uncharacterized protein n=1 Tax=Suillus luteus UH-Slu-Lm8-n1 TaxID=930992 RepID=A0A0D0BRI7_9AGAM|nr:hypothetical protein CY34DRAFT_500933 [Suillus luteus UH-Slu-Lm8-n1]